MKIKVKLVGGGFPEEFIGTTQEVEITNVRLPDGTLWSIDEDFWGLEPVESETQAKEQPKSSRSNTIDFGDNEIKSIHVELK